MTTAGMSLLLRVLRDDDVNGFVGMALSPDMFQDDEIDLYVYIIKHLGEHGVLPKRETVERETGLLLLSMPDPQEPMSYYLADLEKRHLHRSLLAGLETSRDFLKNRDPESALKQTAELAVKLTTHNKRNEMFDFRQAQGPVMAEFKEHVMRGPNYGIRLGWETFDDMTGGLREADTMAIVGRPALGKTYMITWAARNVWWVHHKVALVLSMEMDGLALMQRALGIQAGVNVKQIRDAALTTANMKRIKGAFRAMSDHDVPLWIVDGNMTATVDDLVLLARQLKPDVVFIDGGYLMGHSDPRASSWQKVKDNVEALHKQISKGMGIPTVVSYQFNREITKLKKDQQPGVEHIGMSDAVGQVCSHVVGLFQEETVETLEKRRATILKGREGAVGSFVMSWDFRGMNFGEVVDKKVEDMRYTG